MQWNIPITLSPTTVCGLIPDGYNSDVTRTKPSETRLRDKPLATNIRNRRRAVPGLTQEALAEQLSIGQSAVSKWETGETDPDATMLPKLALALHCSLDDLLAGQCLSYDEIVITHRDLPDQPIGVQRAPIRPSPQEGANDSSTRLFAAEIASLTNAFVGSLQDVVSRFAGNAPEPSTRRPARKAEGRSPHRVRHG